MVGNLAIRRPAMLAAALLALAGVSGCGRATPRPAATPVPVAEAPSDLPPAPPPLRKPPP